MTIDLNLVLTHTKKCGFDSQKEVKNNESIRNRIHY